MRRPIRILGGGASHIPLRVTTTRSPRETGVFSLDLRHLTPTPAVCINETSSIFMASSTADEVLSAAFRYTSTIEPGKAEPGSEATTEALVTSKQASRRAYMAQTHWHYTHCEWASGIATSRGGNADLQIGAPPTAGRDIFDALDGGGFAEKVFTASPPAN